MTYATRNGMAVGVVAILIGSLALAADAPTARLQVSETPLATTSGAGITTDQTPEAPVSTTQPAAQSEMEREPIAATIANEPTAAAAAFAIPWFSFNGGGRPSTSTNSAVNLSIGQSMIGQASNTNYTVGIGFWYGAGGGCACDCHADPQCDGVTNIFDLVHAAAVGIRDEPDIPDPNPRCPRVTTDVNCDGATNIFDLVHLSAVGIRNEDPALHFCDACAP